MLQDREKAEYEIIHCGGWSEIRRKGETQGQWVTSDTTMDVKP